MKTLTESIIGRKGAILNAYGITKKDITGDIKNIPGNRNYVWIYLDKFEAKRRINEFELNTFLQKKIQEGKSVFVQPSQGAIRCDYIYVGRDSEKFLSNYAQELTMMDRLRLDPKKTILENLEENNYGL